MGAKIPQRSVAFLTTRVRAPNRDDWEKLRHLIEYLRKDNIRPLVLGADNDVLDLGIKFPQFRNVYRVSLTKKNTQQFMQCDCLLQYERYGIPCQHILQITNKIEDSMIITCY